MHIKISFALGCIAALSLLNSAEYAHGDTSQRQVQRDPAIEPAEGLEHTFDVSENTFRLNGQPFYYHATEIHPNRIPPQYWRHRLKMVKAMGLNTVSFYIFWNQVESRPGEFNFEGFNDYAKFCRLAQEEGLWVIIRPGPYVCSEWEMGGHPWWLLQHEGIQLRTTDPHYMAASERYLKAVARELAPLQVTQGGPIILCQVENEFPYRDQPYLKAMRQLYLDAGFEVPLISCNPTKGGQRFIDSYRDDLIQTVNFGSRKAAESFEILRKFKPTGPYANGEYYVSGFDFWGESHKTGATDLRVNDMAYMIDNDHSFCLYMGCGGTNFGFTAGSYTAKETAEYPNDKGDDAYRPDTTSYDFDAPISESGLATKKFMAFRELFESRLAEGAQLPPIPTAIPTLSIPEVVLNETAHIIDPENQAIRTHDPKTMEFYDQGYGSIVYRTTLPAGPAGVLSAASVRDFAYVLLDGQPSGIMDRRRRIYQVEIPARPRAMTLDLVVESMGRPNWGVQMIDYKGLVSPIKWTSDGTENKLQEWEIFLLPLDDVHLSKIKFSKGDSNIKGPVFRRGYFNLDQTGDTFIDTRNLGKGMLWVNGYNLGRYWKIGPQQTLYCPGVWLKNGRNEVVVLEYLETENPVVQGLEEPILSKLRTDLDFSQKLKKTSR